MAMEFLELFKEFFVLIIIGICMCIGFVLKNLIPSDKINKFIPLIMALLGVIINVWLNEFAFTPEILLGGLASGLASTGTYEGIKNIKVLIDSVKNIKPPDIE
jgi:hypothetical protein